MKFIPALTEADQVSLEAVHHKAKTHRQRQRAHAVLLSAKGFTLEQLADIFSVDRDTVSGWLNLRQERRLDGLADAPKSGRFRKIDGSLEAVLRDILIENPSRLRQRFTVSQETCLSFFKFVLQQSPHVRRRVLD